jgi:transcriptional regulator with XRE-family HTH domain
MLGAILRRARETAGLTQEQLALEANVDRTYISQLEHDKKSPTIQTLFRLCEAMQASPGQLISELERAIKIKPTK